MTIEYLVLGIETNIWTCLSPEIEIPDLFIDFLGVFEVRRFVTVTVRVDGRHDARG